ncbi:hypothetical protein ACGFS9_15065 [Streptomyces sp. NPDC048566]|uniref:hypothetical protein n=1 Tax=Streptomyces sp. NPDC048566 TaxID=3365569 RepID=UPI00371A2A16
MSVDPLIELHDVNTHFGELHGPQDVRLAVGTGEARADAGRSRPRGGRRTAR